MLDAGVLPAKRKPRSIRIETTSTRRVGLQQPSKSDWAIIRVSNCTVPWSTLLSIAELGRVDCAQKQRPGKQLKFTFVEIVGSGVSLSLAVGQGLASSRTSEDQAQRKGLLDRNPTQVPATDLCIFSCRYTSMQRFWIIRVYSSYLVEQ